ncbi:hypothetical protein O0L34_g5823 [Tuta absoluta]|nr:hypothetical protein O0L34_g5823 [Tuta absoluta]
MAESNETDNSKKRSKEDGGDDDRGSQGQRNKVLWRYFQKCDKFGRCYLCSDELKISQRSTKGLKVHLKSKHNIDIESRDDETEKQPVVPKKKPKTMDSYVIKDNSMEKMVSRMVCKDGFPLSSFCTSADLRDLFSKSGHKLPNSPNTIRSMVTRFCNTVKADMIIEFGRLKKEKQRFSLTFDEWTSQKNHRYLNINVHQEKNHFNLGLVRICGSATAEHCIGLLKERLASFGLDLDTDIIANTTDGASVMVKLGKLLNCSHQLCFTHGLQLVVVDTLYKKGNSPIAECLAATAAITTEESDNDEDDEVDAIEQGVTVSINSTPTEMTPRYDDLLKKVRKVVKIFKRSPTKNDLFLQKYVRERGGPQKELSLILDCRTRWSSLFDMLERFYNLKNCINKALIDIESEIKFSEEEWFKIHDLITCLEPFKYGVEALCRREATLMSADLTFRFILNKLQEHDTVLSNQLAQNLRERIQQRRTVLTGVLSYLQNPKKYDQEARSVDPTFFMPKKAAIRQEIKKIIERVNKIEDEKEEVEVLENTPTAGTSDTDTVPTTTLTLKEELEQQLQQEKEIFKRKPDNIQKDLEKILKKEMTNFESDGVRGDYLTLAYKYMLTIQPTSVEAERAFSASGYICSSLRSRLGDDTIDTICFLRAYFQKQSP